jgi:carboxylesterase type B
VRIVQGALQGKVMTSRKGRRIHAFQGIPYAEPPVGDLRFQVRKMELFTFADALIEYLRTREVHQRGVACAWPRKRATVLSRMTFLRSNMSARKTVFISMFMRHQ